MERKKTAFLHAHAHAVQLLLWTWYPADYNEAGRMEGEARALRKSKEQSEAIQEIDRILAEKDHEIEENNRKIAERKLEIQELKARIRAMQESAG